MKVFNLNGMSEGEKKDLFASLEQMLVKQALSQHLELDEHFLDNKQVLAYHIDREKECLKIAFTDGEEWVYSCIDCGAEGMKYKLTDKFEK